MTNISSINLKFSNIVICLSHLLSDICIRIPSLKMLHPRVSPSRQELKDLVTRIEIQLLAFRLIRSLRQYQQDLELQSKLECVSAMCDSALWRNFCGCVMTNE